MTDMNANPPPGWHADPWAQGGYRWWDGVAWTALVAPAPWSAAVPAPWSAPPSGPLPAIADALRWSGYAAKAMVVWAGVVVVQALIIPFVLTAFFEDLRELDTTTGDTTAFSNSSTSATVPLNGVGSLSFAAFIVFAIWTYNGTKAMDATGHRTTHSAGWAAAGWLVPIINLWYPYQAVRDLVPVDHPMRRRVGWWWACWLLTSMATFAPMVGAWFSVGAALLLALVPIALAVAGGMLGHRIAKAAGEGFDELGRKVAAWAG